MAGFFSYEAHILYILQLCVIGLKSEYLTWLACVISHRPLPLTIFT